METIVMAVVGSGVCFLLYKMSRSLGRIEATIEHVVDGQADHELRIRKLEKD